MILGSRSVRVRNFAPNFTRSADRRGSPESTIRQTRPFPLRHLRQVISENAIGNRFREKVTPDCCRHDRQSEDRCGLRALPLQSFVERLD